MNTTNTQIVQAENKEQRTHKFDQGSVFSVLLKTAIPIVVLMFFNSMYAFIDSLMSSAYVDYGTVDGTATGVPLNGGTIVGLVLPFMSMLVAFEVMIAVGAGLSYTQSLAQNNPEEARERHNQAMSMIIYIGVIVMLVTMVIGMPYILSVSGNWHHNNVWGDATKEMVLDGYSYMVILTIAFIPMQLQQSYTRILRAEGRGNIAAMIPIMTMPVNIFFDWLFMSVLNTGIKGAGVATLIATTSGLLMMMIYVYIQGMNDRLVLKLKAPTMRISKEVSTVILIFAMGSFIRRILDSSTMVLISGYVGNVKISADSALSIPDWQGSWTVMTRSINMGAQLSLGVAQAMSMLISYYNNSQQTDKIKQTINYGAASMVMCSMFTIVLLTSIQGVLFNAYDPNRGYGWAWGNQISIAFMLALVYSVPLSLQPMPVMFYAATKKPKWTLIHSASFNAIVFGFATIGVILNHITFAPLYLFGFIAIGGVIGYTTVLITFVIRYKQIIVN